MKDTLLLENELLSFKDIVTFCNPHCWFFHLGNVIGNTSMAAWAQAVR